MHDKRRIYDDVISGKNESFCIMPWIGFSGGSDGSFRLCCFDTDRWRGLKLGSINSIKIQEYHKSKQLAEIRKKMLSGERIRNCSYCYDQEKIGVESKRLYEIYHRKELVKESIYSTNLHTGETSMNFSYLDIRFSNICNLACRMCSSESSTNRKELDRRILGEKSVWDTYSGNWSLDKFRGQDIYLDGLTKIYIAGGEPLIDNDQKKFIDMLISSGRSKNIKLQFNTNLTVIPNNFFHKMKYFKSVHMIVSCDGYGKKYEYIRIKGNWKNFLKNLIITKEQLLVKISIVVQRDNIEDIPKLYVLLSKLGIKDFNIIILIYSKFLAIKNIEIQKRPKILQIYNYYFQKYSNIYPKMQEDLSEIISVLQHEKPLQEHIDEYYKNTPIIDKYIEQQKSG